MGRYLLAVLALELISMSNASQNGARGCVGQSCRGRWEDDDFHLLQTFAAVSGDSASFMRTQAQGSASSSPSVPQKQALSQGEALPGAEEESSPAVSQQDAATSTAAVVLQARVRMVMNKSSAVQIACVIVVACVFIMLRIWTAEPNDTLKSNMKKTPAPVQRPFVNGGRAPWDSM
mmetsp:Transcript_97784/g.218219  ORF Transcript_97784/g.218219 Transcript_97784/m.218219 type:complete len:176 (-) Transcript_97784:37-564(-)